MRGFFMHEKRLRAVIEVLTAALATTLFYLIATALAAVFVRAYVPKDGVVVAVNWIIRCLGAFLLPALLLRGERLFFKGLAAGAAAAVLAMLLFAAIGGGFPSALFLLELLLCALLAGCGALLGAKLHRG